MRKSISISIALVSCDLNGTLVHQHTMMDMIRVCFSDQPQRFKKAKEAFNLLRNAIAHIGDTMGDSAGICEVAQNGGLGIAFSLM